MDKIQTQSNDTKKTKNQTMNTEIKEPTVYQWLQTPCKPEEVKGDAETGFFLGIDRTREKIKYMEETFGVSVHYSDFNHITFMTPDRNCFMSGSLSMVLSFVEGKEKKLVGAATFNLQEYYPNQHFAATLKSLCICNALFNEYPQFGSLLNKEPEPGKVAPPIESLERREFRAQLAKCKTVNDLFQYNKKSKGMRDIYNEKLKQLQNDSIK